MTDGWLNENWDLIIPMRILDANGHVHRIEATIDTGFNGCLTLPPDFAQLLGLPPAPSLDITMANDATEAFPTYTGTVLWHGQHRSVQIVELHGKPLVGLELLWDSLLTAEITDHGAVSIAPLPPEPSPPDGSP